MCRGLRRFNWASLACMVSVGDQSDSELAFRLQLYGQDFLRTPGQIPWLDFSVTLRSSMGCPGMQLDFVMPKFGADVNKPFPRPATYACAVGLVWQALRLPPLNLCEAEAHKVTLPACRRLLPTLAGQMLMSIESRRALGHCRPQSAEPLRYDTSRCVSELAYKAQISSHVVAGWLPAQLLSLRRRCQRSLRRQMLSYFDAWKKGEALTSIGIQKTSKNFAAWSHLHPEPAPAAPAVPVAGETLSSGWVSNASPHVKGKPRCLHILAAPGVTKCGWKFRTVSCTPNFFLS